MGTHSDFFQHRSVCVEGCPGWDVLSGAQHRCPQQRPTRVTLTEAGGGGAVQAEGRLGVTAEGGRPAQRDGGLSGYEEEEEGPGPACVAREPPEQQKDQQDRHHPTSLQADSMGPPPHKVPFPRGLVWELHPGEGGEESREGRRRRDGFSNTHTASFLGPPFPRPLLECSAPSLASVASFSSGLNTKLPSLPPWPASVSDTGLSV